MPAVPRREIHRRVRALQDRLASAEPPLDVAVILEHVDLYYLSGTVQTAHLLVPVHGTPRLLVRKVLERAREDSPLEDIRSMTSLRQLTDALRELCGPPPWRIGMELDVIPVLAHRRYRELLGDGTEIHDVSGSLLELRSVKSDWEIEQIRDAARINERIYRELSEFLSADLSSYELQAILDCRARTAGHVGLVRMRGFNVNGLIGVVASGASGAMPGHSEFPIGGLGPHPVLAHGGDLAKLERDTPIVFDYLASVTGYHHDQTRMAVIGRFPPEAERIYEGMREILRAVEAGLRPGRSAATIYAEALDHAGRLGLADGFMGLPRHAVRFVGHSIGLEVNEMPVLARKFDRPIEVGNVFAVEPKFTHPRLGVIGLENTYAIRQDGCENLGSTPEDVVSVS